jgi:hypoxanthine phosphoribosyltransferase
MANPSSDAVVKDFVSAQRLLKNSMLLAKKVYDAGFRPTWIIALWRGGAPIGMCVQEFFKYRGVKTDHVAVRTSSYTAIGQQSRHIDVHCLEYVVKNANAQDRMLIVDDIFDSGRSVEALLSKLKHKMRANLPTDIRIATVFYKPTRNKTTITPDYYCEETDRWIVMPHELEGLDPQEIMDGKGAFVATLVLPPASVSS